MLRRGSLVLPSSSPCVLLWGVCLGILCLMTTQVSQAAPLVMDGISEDTMNDLMNRRTNVNFLSSSSPPQHVLISVLSAPKNILKRRAIRNSWMELAKRPNNGFMVDVRFFIGNTSTEDAQLIEGQLAEEQTFQDIVRLPELMESYNNLTLKTALIMEYAYNQEYVAMFKVDDDDFVRVDLFCQRLSELGDTTNLYWGRLKRKVPVIKDGSRKWFDGLFNGTTYPDYMLGSGYVVGRSILHHVATNRQSLTMYANEDASVGIWSQELLGLRKVPMKQMVLQPDCIQDAIVVNSVSEEEQAVLLSNLQTTNNLCANHFYLEVCSDEPCKCCVDPRTNKFAQVDGACCD